jgi:hypothetical protein
MPTHSYATIPVIPSFTKRYFPEPPPLVPSPHKSPALINPGADSPYRDSLAVRDFAANKLTILQNPQTKIVKNDESLS